MIDVGRVQLPIPSAGWNSQTFMDFVETAAEYRQAMLDGIENEIARHWGPLGITDWLVTSARACDIVRWPTTVASLVTDWRDGWSVQPIRADIVGAFIAHLISTNDEPLRKELCKAIAQIHEEETVGEVAEHLYWPSCLASHDYMEAAERLEFLIRSAPASTIYGALGEKTEGTHGNGVIRIGVHVRKSETSEWSLNILPWSRHVPTSKALNEQESILKTAIGNARELSYMTPHEVFLNLQPAAASNHEAISHVRQFDGQSLGLAILLVLNASVKHRHIDGWATGEIAANGINFGSADLVSGKAKALGHFLTKNGGLKEAERGRFRLFVAGEANKSDVTKGLGDSLSAEFLDRMVIAGSVDELLQPEKLWDPFHLEPGLCQEFFARVGIPDAVAFPTPGDTEFLHALAHVEQDAEAEDSDTLGGQVAYKWIGWDEEPQRDLDAREILACIPFHDGTKIPRNFLRHSAARLAAYLRWQRAMQQRPIAGTLLPVPVVLEVRKWKASQMSLAEFLLSEASQGLNESGPTLKEIHSSNDLNVEHLQEALSDEHRFCVVLTDADIDRSRTFEEPAVTLEDRVNQPFWNAIETLLGHRSETGVARQCLLLLAPDIHVQMFWEEQLRKMPYDLEFKTEKLPIAAAIQD